MSLYLIIMGVQGAGKGMQAGIISEQYNIPHVSTGDLFRAMKTREDELAKRIQEIMKAGQLISDDVTNEVLKDRLEQPDAANGVILDGYPRNLAQAAWLEQYLTSRGAKLDAALLLELDLYAAFKRAFGRVTASDGQTYNIYYNADGLEWRFTDHPERQYPPRLEAYRAGEALTRRPDDASADAVLKRIDTFLEATAPLVTYYDQKGLLLRINADQSIEAVTADIRKAVDQVRS
jgi:adenylate kinase